MAVLFIHGTAFTEEMEEKKMGYTCQKQRKYWQSDEVGPCRLEGFDCVQATHEAHAVLVLFLQLIKLFKFSNTFYL